MDERGSAAVEVALVTPLLMLLVLGLVQFGLWYQAEEVVIAAAQEAVAQASTESGDPRAAEARAQALLQGLRGMTEGREVRVEPIGAERVAVTVRAKLKGILPGVSGLALHARAVSRVERVP